MTQAEIGLLVKQLKTVTYLLQGESCNPTIMLNGHEICLSELKEIVLPQNSIVHLKLVGD